MKFLVFYEMYCIKIISVGIPSGNRAFAAHHMGIIIAIVLNDAAARNYNFCVLPIHLPTPYGFVSTRNPLVSWRVRVGRRYTFFFIRVNCFAPLCDEARKLLLLLTINMHPDRNACRNQINCSKK